jgi:hypothetical protein
MLVTPERLADQLETADALLAGSKHLARPQDLPGHYGRVIRALDQVLSACQIEAAVAGGWAVWRHGYIGRVIQNVDIALPADRIEEFLTVASVSGFEATDETGGQLAKAQTQGNRD